MGTERDMERASEERPSGDDERYWDMGLSEVFGGQRKKAARPTPTPPSDENRYGRYRLIREIGRGGMGVIHHAYDEDLRRDVALKVLRERHADHEGMLHRFLEEAQIGGQLQHPGIVPVYEMGLTPNGEPFFSMKLVRGRTLAALLADRESPAEDRGRFLGIFEQVCQTLAYAHDRRVIHRDLKPSNVMVGTFGEVQVADWGFAKVLGGGEVGAGNGNGSEAVATVRSRSGSSSSMTGSVLGTPFYMPPEQARGKVEALDERADVFALGAILCEVLTGRPPYEPGTEDPIEQARAASLDAAHARLRESGADQALIDLAVRCLQAQRQNRPRNAGVIAEAVAAYLTGIERRTHEAQMAAAEARGRAVEEQKAHRLALAVALLILIVVILGGGILWGIDAARRRGLASSQGEAGDAIVAARAHLEQERWAAAEEALLRAEIMAKPGRSGRRNARTIAKLRAEVERARSAKAETVARRVREAELRREVEVLLAAPLAPDDAVLSAYRDLFTRHEVAKAGEAFDPQTRKLVILGLDDCLLRGLLGAAVRGDPEEQTEIEACTAMASALDDDPWRSKLRAACAQSCTDDVRGLPEGLGLVDRHPVRLGLLAWILHREGNQPEVLSFLRRACRAHSGAAVLHHLHASIASGWIDTGVLLATGAEPGQLEEPLRHAWIAASLQPRGVVVARHLSALLLATGRFEESKDVVERTRQARARPR